MAQSTGKLLPMAHPASCVFVVGSCGSLPSLCPVIQQASCGLASVLWVALQNLQKGFAWHSICGPVDSSLLGVVLRLVQHAPSLWLVCSLASGRPC